MKKRSCISILFAVSLVMISALSVSPEKKIVENVVVEEWIVPIYVVDARGDSVTDLNQNEIELYVNDNKVSKFNFVRKKFFSGDKKSSKWFRTNKEEDRILIKVPGKGPTQKWCYLLRFWAEKKSETR